jgi:hypothetical protein
VPTPSLNLTRHQLDTVHIHPDSISRTLTKAALPAKMRIAASLVTPNIYNVQPAGMLPSICVKLSKRFDSIQWRDGQVLIFLFIAGAFPCGWRNVWPRLFGPV